MAQSASKIGKDIAAGKTDPVALVEEVIEAINASAHRDDIFSTVTNERAIKEAKAAHKRQKQEALKGPLDGVPISWKDLFDTKGIPTEAGSPYLKDRLPKKDCKVLENASEAGLVCTGKTHMSELAFSGLGINPNSATPPNVHDEKLAPGGSSSGAAASVAHGFVPIGIGSDTGGSVRIPAAWNDLVGLKTTSGFLPNDGVVPLCKGFDTVGPLCNSVEDAWLITAIMAGEKPELPAGKPIDECHFFVNQTIALDCLANAQDDGFRAAIDVLGSAGAKIEYGEIDVFDDMLPLGPILFPYEAWQEWSEQIIANPDVMFKPVEGRFRAGEHITKKQYDNAWEAMLELRATYKARTADYDGVLAPTVCIGPPNVEELLNDYEMFSKSNLLALRNTRFGNMFGLCALTLPTPQPSSGIMLSGKAFGEKDLVSVGLTVEKLLSENA